jgi:glycosyltransferase involved in cell wall biosynthesis
MSACDVFAMPSFEEPFGLVFAEAMAMCRPVVAISSGGALEVVSDGETGLLSPPGDPDALAENLCRILGDRTLGLQMGRAGRRRVEKEFSPERLSSDFAQLYTSLIGGTSERLARAI